MDTPFELTPDLDLLRQEYVLVQAWKKTASYIRSHSWYSDTLELDRATVNLPRFLAELSEELQTPAAWQNEALRIVLAPKSQEWRVEEGRWSPAKKDATPLRPLGHVSLRDQVVATAILMCLADRVETEQGDTRTSLDGVENRRRVMSYGNRLFCDRAADRMRHRWGSTKLYRSYYQDYRAFIERPERVSADLEVGDGLQVVVVHSDLSQFYDRVRPALLLEKLNAYRQDTDDQRFFSFAQRLLSWTWDSRDDREVTNYEQQSDIRDFRAIALPQGLVAAGFLSNCVLRDFDSALRMSFGEDVGSGAVVADACRYVDDLRIVVVAPSGLQLQDLEDAVHDKLQATLEATATGLACSRKKTRAALIRGDQRPLLRQSRRMARIQRAVSGGFDALGGEEILDAVQGLIGAQRRFAADRPTQQGWSFAPVPDVRDETVARFAAGRYRYTYRSLRPLLQNLGDDPVGGRWEPELTQGRSSNPRTQGELDDEARTFALSLIEQWVEDPSNVRLLRIGLDIWPSADLLARVLELLRPLVVGGGRRTASGRVAQYCLSEVFRAAATETGIVRDGECLSSSLDLEEYRRVLLDEAARLSSMPHTSLPWYLRQQILLFVAANASTRMVAGFGGRETESYRQLLRFVSGDVSRLNDQEFATIATLARRSFISRDAALSLASEGITPRRWEALAERDPSFAVELLPLVGGKGAVRSARLRRDLCLDRSPEGAERVTLADEVLNEGATGRIRNEEGCLRFAAEFLRLRELADHYVITPTQVSFARFKHEGLTFKEFRVVHDRASALGSIYSPPQWSDATDRWRYQLGYLLRFILVGCEDFTRPATNSWRRDRGVGYRAPESHWHQRRHGMFQGHQAYGHDWLPISNWTEDLIAALLEWPGCRPSAMSHMVSLGRDAVATLIEDRLSKPDFLRGRGTGLLMLSVNAPMVGREAARPLRACIVQAVAPQPTTDDPSLSAVEVRRRHRNHLSAALAAIERMLELRETHAVADGRLDWLILPELSVHPHDVETHLLPFARTHKAIILAGLTYQELVAGRPLVNSALWVIPVSTKAHGLQMLIRRQGKEHLAPAEQAMNRDGAVLQGFRPCQWLIGYQWSQSSDERPLWLTAAICYDATDIRLASDLRKRSDVFAVPALNKDVNTFDQMALALHYHMFQMVIIANNGQYGGSNAYAPYKDHFRRQVFHLHGQPQASIAFVDIEPEAFLRRAEEPPQTKQNAPDVDGHPWKYRPAGL